jgi:hypothetical protein
MAIFRYLSHLGTKEKHSILQSMTEMHHGGLCGLMSSALKRLDGDRRQGPIAKRGKEGKKFTQHGHRYRNLEVRVYRLETSASRWKSPTSGRGISLVELAG